MPHHHEPPTAASERDLDKALQDTFPASDPVAATTQLTATPTSDSVAASDRSGDHPGTVTVYRVVSDEMSTKPFGEGPNRAGRWTSDGTPAVYATLSPATALLEFLVHCDGAPPETVRLATAQLPVDRISVMQAYPSTWRERPYGEDVQRVGDAWSSSHQSLAARVPSALCEDTSNVIINPAHVDAPLLQGVQVTQVRIDDRLRRLGG